MATYKSGKNNVQNIPRRFKLLAGAYYHPPGTIVYPCKRRNYELEKQMTEKHGSPCTTMTPDPNGDFPAFVVPRKNLEEIPYE